MQAILITGGAGFIGANMCTVLLADRYHVTCLDNLSTGSYGNISDHISNPNFEFVESDVRQSFPRLEVDTVINLACPASPVHYQADPIRTMETSVLGTINALNFCEATGARLIHASTSEVYGDPQVHPQSEKYVGHVNPIGPRSCYDEGKRAAETQISDYIRTRGVRADIVRIFNTYGPYMQIDDGRVVSNFIVQALQGKPLTVFGDGSQTRSMCFVDDLVDGFIALIEKESGVEGPINMGNPHEITIRDFAEAVIKWIGSTAPLTFEALPEDDPMQRRPDISKARAELNWAPKVELEDGVGRTIAYFKSQLRLT